MTTSENTASDQAIEPRGFMETLLGGLAGATIGVIIGIPLSNIVTRDSGLEGIATALLILFLGLCAGAALGAGIALRLRKRPRPLFTGLMTLPAMFIGAYVAVFLATRLTDTDVLLLPFVVIASILALLAARGIATAGRVNRDAIKGD